MTDVHEQEELLQLLHDLGVILHYEDMKVHDTEVLNPHWLTGGVYKVINSRILADRLRGIFNLPNLVEIMNEDLSLSSTRKQTHKSLSRQNKPRKFGEINIPEDKYPFLLDMMKQFELCYEADEAKVYIVPELLSINPPDTRILSFDPRISFTIEYKDFLPTSIFPRLMVRLHNYIHKDYFWRGGVFLKSSGAIEASSLILVDKVDRSINIQVTGSNAKSFLSFIRNTIKEINNSFHKLMWSERIHLDIESDYTVDYQDVLASSLHNKDTFVSGQSFKEYNVQAVLNIVEEPEVRRKLSNKLSAFVSYSKSDKKYLDHFIRHLHPIQDLAVWSDLDLIAGEDWDQKIRKRLLQADIIFYLVSPYSNATQYIHETEMPIIQQRVLKGSCLLIPIILSSCKWPKLDFAKYAALPRKGTAIRDSSKWPNQDVAWLEVIDGIEKAIANFKSIGTY